MGYNKFGDCMVCGIHVTMETETGCFLSIYFINLCTTVATYKLIFHCCFIHKYALWCEETKYVYKTTEL